MLMMITCVLFCRRRRRPDGLSNCSLTFFFNGIYTAKPFDMYTASKEFPMQVEQKFPNDRKGWTVRTKVDAADKLKEVDRQRRLAKGEKIGMLYTMYHYIDIKNREKQKTKTNKKNTTNV
jgi:hypothetical protein